MPVLNSSAKNSVISKIIRYQIECKKSFEGFLSEKYRLKEFLTLGWLI